MKRSLKKKKKEKAPISSQVTLMIHAPDGGEYRSFFPARSHSRRSCVLRNTGRFPYSSFLSSRVSAVIPKPRGTVYSLINGSL